MTKIYILLFAATLLFSCSNNKAPRKTQPEKAVITVSILPEKTFVEKIAGNDFKVNVLIPPGASPAAYTLLPSQLKDITQSDIWFRVGYIGFEQSWAKKIAQANTKMKVVDLSKGLDLIAQTVEKSDGQKIYEGVNPHIWLSPVLVKQISKVILDQLIAIKPEKTQEYTQNYQHFIKKCDMLDTQLKEMLKNYKGKKFILYHPSLSYYARDYGLKQYSLETGGKEPTSQHLRELIDMAESENIKIVYIQNDLDKEHARVFAEEIGGKVIPIWPLNPEWEENLLHITKLLTENFN